MFNRKERPQPLSKAIIGKGRRLLNGGFMNLMEIQNFPAKGKEVFLILKQSKTIVHKKNLFTSRELCMFVNIWKKI